MGRPFLLDQCDSPVDGVMAAVRRCWAMRGRGMATGVVVLAIAAGFGASSAAVASASHVHPREGTVRGHVFPWNSTRVATVEMFNAIGRLVARRAVHESHPQFRFVVAPGRCKIELKAGGVVCSPDTVALRVRARRTIRLNLSEACGNSY